MFIAFCFDLLFMVISRFIEMRIQQITRPGKSNYGHHLIRSEMNLSRGDPTGNPETASMGVWAWVTLKENWSNALT